MSSWQAKFVNKATQIIIRRPKWGKDENTLAKRARFIFGAPLILRLIATRGLNISKIAQPPIQGEWIKSKTPQKGTILYIHGGGFISCSPTTHQPITAGLARFSNFSVFALDYRLAPEHRFPAALEDTVTAYKWLLDQGIASQNIALAGDSAGGGLVLSLLLQTQTMGLPLPACAVCFSPWIDLAGTGQSIKFNNGHCDMFYPQNILDFAAAYLGNSSPQNPLASPLYANLTGLPPILIQVSSKELLLDDSRELHQSIQKNNGISKLEIYNDVIHCWQILNGFMPESTDALKKAATFITQHINS
jgi:acetyl esterase/lipase